MSEKSEALYLLRSFAAFSARMIGYSVLLRVDWRIFAGVILVEIAQGITHD